MNSEKNQSAENSLQACWKSLDNKQIYEHWVQSSLVFFGFVSCYWPEFLT